MRGGVVPGGQLPELGLRNRRNLRNTLLNVRTRLQEHFDDSNSIQGLRFDVLDVVDGSGQRSLGDANDAIAHVFRYEAVVIPDDADNGNVDVREDVGGRANNRKPTHYDDEYRQHDERIRSPQR